MLKHTKIVATVSDQRCEVEFIDALYKAGMNVVRLNTAHMAEEGLTRVVNNVRTVSNRIGILMDTKGPEVRTTAAQAPIEFKTGEMVKIVGNPEGETSHDCICVSYRNFVNDLTVGSDILIDDGDLELKVIDKKDDFLVCEVENDATLGSRKSVIVPGVRINLPSLTEKDRKNILWAIENDLDFIAHSFVRNKQDVMDIQRILDEHNSPIKIIAKIENRQGVKNIDEILRAADGIMVARGAKGNPWIFNQNTHYLETGELLPRPSVEELKAMILRHGQMMMEFKGELAGMREMRKHVAWYTAGYQNSAALRNEINSVATLEELTELIGTRL